MCSKGDMAWKSESPVAFPSASAMPARIARSSLLSNTGGMPPFQIWRNGLEQEAVISSPSNSSHELAGRAMSAYSIDAVIWMSIDTIISTFWLTFLIMSYACLALLIRFTLVNSIALVGVGMWVWPVKILRPNFGVLTISALSPWFQ